MTAFRTPIEPKTRAETVKNNLETAARWIAVALSIGGFVWGVYTFLTSSTVQSRRPFFDNQLAIYRQAIQTVQVLATSESRTDAEWKNTQRKFYQLYWGEMGFVENAAVASAMIEIDRCLQGSSCGKSDLERLSLNLAHACRDSVAASWGVSNSKELPENR